MVGTGANRMPLTKVHPVLLGQQKRDGTSLLAQHRQQHQERIQQRNSPSAPNQMSGPPPGYGQQYGGGGPPMKNQMYPPPNMYQQQRPPPPFNQMPPPPGYGPPPNQQNYQQGQQYGNIQPQTNATSFDEAGNRRKRKRTSRWGDKEDKTIVNGPTTLPANLTEEQRQHYLIQFKIEEITLKLRTGELGIPSDPVARSPSPEPIYNSEGKRLNTREFRVRKKLEEERHTLIKQAIEEIASYKPPVDYKPPASKICDKVFIPAERNPAVNFIGLLIGPRGNTLKRLEKETGCKIIIRGKGSVKEGKVGRIPGQLMPGEDEPLHALITGPTEKEVKKGVQVVTDIVKEGIECPDAANELRRNQLRELAELNGTLIDEEVIKCKNCGATDHRHWECQEQKNVTSQVTCHKCGGYGHVAVDCRAELDSATGPLQTFAEKAKMDTEYMSLMAELGVDAPQPAKKNFQDQPPRQDAKGPNDRGRNSYQENNQRRESKWGPPSGNSQGPKSLMDMNFGNKSNPSNQYGPPGGTNNQPPPWLNQSRGPGPQGPSANMNHQAAPWQQGPPRGGPPQAFDAAPPPPPQTSQMPPTATYPQQNQQGGWQQQTGYPQWQNPYGYNPYQQMQNSYAAPPPPWNQQPPPPPPPPPPSS